MRILRNIDYGDILPFGIINRIFRPALLTVEDGDHTASVVDHPFIAALEAATIITERCPLEFINEFREKTSGDGNLINIGFMVCQPEFFDYIDGDDTVLEKKPLETVAKLGELMAYKHTGFWQCMDTVREKEQLEKMWSSNNAPWKIWK